MLYRLVKDTRLKKQYRRSSSFLPFLGVGLGVAILAVTVWPVLSWQIINQNKAVTSDNLALPAPKKDILGLSDKKQVGDIAVEVKRDPEGFSFFEADASTSARPYDEFQLTIEKIKIKSAKAKVWTNDFSKSLALLPGTSLPGSVGNVFLTGHSALPALSSPTDYRSIFTELTKLEFGDEIILDAGGQKYTYLVEKTSVVDPSDVSVIAPPDPYGKYLTLMTCVPPGLSTQRLIVRARLN